MKKKAFLSLFLMLYAIGWLDPKAKAQTLSGSSLSITGTGTISALVSNTASIVSGSMGSLVVGGTVDILGNTIYFGSWTADSTLPGYSIFYDDGVSGSNSSLIQTLTRPQAVWNWQRMAQSGSATQVMQIDSSNRLVLTGTDPNNPGQLVLDPNGPSGQNNVLTQQAADSRYVSSSAISIGIDTWGLGNPTVGIEGGSATGPYSYAGIGATASGVGACAESWGNAAGDYSYARGMWSNAYGAFSTAGGNATASGDWSVALGNCSSATGQAAHAFGCGSQATQLNSTALGHNACAFGVESTAVGNYSSATGYYSTTSGVWSVASGNYSNAIGAWSTASGDQSVSAGVGTVASGYSQFVVGSFNIPQGNPFNWVDTDDLFTVGNGVKVDETWVGGEYDENGNWVEWHCVPIGNLSNAFVVKKNGNATLYGTFTVSGTNAGLVITGTAVQVTTSTGSGTKIVASGTSHLVLIPEQGDLSMGDFINGTQPISSESSQPAQQQSLLSRPVTTGVQASAANNLDSSAMRAAVNAKANTLQSGTAVGR